MPRNSTHITLLKRLQQTLYLLLFVAISDAVNGQENGASPEPPPQPELIKHKESKFKELYTIKDLSLKRFKNIVPALSGLDYKNVRSGNYPGQTEFKLSTKEKELLERSFGGLFVNELKDWKRFPLVAEPELESIYLKVGLSSIISFVPPPRTRRENPANKILSGALHMELFDLTTGHMIMKIEDRFVIRDLQGMRYDEFIWSIEAVQSQFSSFGANLKTELERFDK